MEGGHYWIFSLSVQLLPPSPSPSAHSSCLLLCFFSIWLSLPGIPRAKIIFSMSKESGPKGSPTVCICECVCLHERERQRDQERPCVAPEQRKQPHTFLQPLPLRLTTLNLSPHSVSMEVNQKQAMGYLEMQIRRADPVCIALPPPLQALCELPHPEGPAV